jgi:hypothetical protein
MSNEEKKKGSPEQKTTPWGTGQATTPWQGLQQGEPDSPAEDLSQAEGVEALSERYEILTELGRGGMGVVYKARDRETGDVVALKVLQAEIAGRPDLIERFKSELLLARKITHKNVCRVYELLRFGKVAAIAMEYVEGDSLRAILERFRGVPLRAGVLWARQICAALAEAHSQGVVHRDLKPENILITAEGTAKVMDFGIARSVEAGTTTTGMIVGTPAYMSPEQAEGKPVDARSDIYSLGLVLYEMFTGHAAFHGDTPVVLVTKQITETPARPREIEPHLPLFLAQAIEKCTEKDPKKRFQSVVDLDEALGEKAAVAPMEARRSESEEEVVVPLRLAVWQRFDNWLAAMSVVGLIAFFLLFGRTYPYGRWQPAITEGEASKIALQELRKGDWADATFTEAQQVVFPVPMEPSEYSFLVSSEGLAEANRKAQSLSLSRLVVFEVLPKNGTAVTAKVLFGRDGQVLATDRGKTPEAFAARNRLLVAVGAFGKEKSVTLRGKIDFFGELRQLGLAERYASWGVRGITALGLIMLLVFVAKNLYRQSLRLAIGSAVAAMLAATGVVAYSALLPEYGGSLDSWEPPASYALALLHMALHPRVLDPLFSVLATMAVGFLVFTALFSVAEHYLGRTLRSSLSPLQKLVRRPSAARPAGLSLMRGCMLGVTYVALHTCMILLIGGTKAGGPALAWLQAGRSGPMLVAYALSLALLATLGAAWVLLAFPASVAYRISRRAIAPVIAVAALWMLTGFTLPGASAFPLLPLVVVAGLQGAFFAGVLYRYDFLTALTAIFSVQTWLLIYPVFVIVQEVVPLASRLALLPWFLLLMMGIIAGFWAQLQEGWRRVARVFD